MRRLVALVALATTSLLLIAFLVPLGLLVRTLAADRAAGAAQQEAQALVPVVASVRDPGQLTLVLQRVNSGTTRRVTVFLPDGRQVGARAQAGPSLALARQGRAFSTTVPGGRAILQPVQTAAGTAVITSFVPAALLTRGVRRALTVLGLLGLALLAVSILVADRLARGLVRPMSELAAVAARLEGGDLTARVAPSGPPEIREVGTALNRLAERIRVPAGTGSAWRTRDPKAAGPVPAGARCQCPELDRARAGHRPPGRGGRRRATGAGKR